MNNYGISAPAEHFVGLECWGLRGFEGLGLRVQGFRLGVSGSKISWLQGVTLSDGFCGQLRSLMGV